MDRYFVEKENWNDFIKKLLSDYEVYAPVEAEGDLFFKKLAEIDVPNIVWDRYRTADPAKKFVNPFLEEVCSKREKQIKKIAVLGLRNCDLSGFDLLDKIFDDPACVDPFYRERRQNAVFVGSDCGDIRSSCFCAVWDINPFPEKNFDLSVSKLKDGFVLEVATQVGRNTIIKGDLKTGTLNEVHLNERQEYRNKVIEKLRKSNSEYHFFAGSGSAVGERVKLVEEKEDSPVWQEHSKTCVTCGACTQVCPTCHCFLLAELKGNDFEKNKYWDSCQFTGYGRVAGGANPRAKISERLANRYFCKLKNRPLSFDGVYGCTGCGRCIEACQGKIDIRKVIKDLSKGCKTGG